MNAAAQRRLTPPLAVLALGLGALLLAFASGLGRRVRWDPPRPPAPLPEAAAARLPPARPLQQFAEVWQQPLFNPDRKPAVFAAGGQSNLGEFKLTGVILTPGLHMALLRGRGGNELRVREGERLPDGGATLVELKPRSARFEGSGGRVELELPAGAPIDLPAPPGAASAPAPEVRAGAAPPPRPMQGSPLAPRMGLPAPPASANAKRPPLDQDTLQNERIQQLKDAMQRRRAERAAAAQQGER
ncbi:hypothetical protein [Frateuria defendens]|uniref:hypothetical protein n=1 Tax=Frateuria defendens TaxID=2219559 RepID=UPI00066FBCFE|nr:hypothetical protein [Frateuria defendens]